MNLLAIQLQKAGLPFMSAKATHNAQGIRIDEIVCASHEDRDRVDAWAVKQGYPARARVATPEEIADHKRWEELA